jgi:5-methylcytosine-specific restriction protein A
MPTFKRSREFWFAAYFLSKFGHRLSGSGTATPPSALGISTWNETYALFYPALGDGRSPSAFRNSLKNARDSYDATFTESGRQGWWQSKLTEAAMSVITEWSARTEHQVIAEIRTLLSRPTQTLEKLPLASLALGVSQGRSQGVQHSKQSRQSSSSPKSSVIGQLTEELVFDHLKLTLGQAALSLRHHSKLGEKPGYDISYKNEQGLLQAVEVKGTVALSMTGFTLTENERIAAENLGDDYILMLVIGVPHKAKYQEIRNPIRKWKEGQISFTPSEWNVRKLRVS